jgi:hypothetical protein
MQTTQNELDPYKTDDLILLVGSNPLPNYVAAKLLLKTGGNIHLIGSKETQQIVETLKQKLGNTNIHVLPNIEHGKPENIFSAVSDCVKGLRGNGAVGLHYTGGTKAMAVHAYRAVKACKPDAVFSYLDAHSLSLIIDGEHGKNGGKQDIVIPVEPKDLEMDVTALAGLHNIEFKNPPLKEPKLLELSEALQYEFENGDTWRCWLRENAMEYKKGRFIPQKANDLKKISIPVDRFKGLHQALGKPSEATIPAWARAAKYSDNKFVEWAEGGYWLESVVFSELQKIKEVCKLNDIGMEYHVKGDGSDDKFEFDVAAVRGYQLFAISCTTDASNNLCKSKLFEAHNRARMLGGDEAKVALVCYHANPQKVLKDFKSNHYFAEGSVKVFGKPELPKLSDHLKEWIGERE